MNRRWLACGVAALLALAHTLLGFPVSAEQPEVDESNRLELDVQTVTPRLVQKDSRTLTVLGEITNIGDRPISDVRARLQLGTRQSTTDEMVRALSGEAATDAQLSPFEVIVDELAPGESYPLRIQLDLQGGEGGFLLTDPGVYPLLINVNGQPAFGGPARLAALSMLLPVFETPGSSGEAETGPPTPMSVLWPIAATPSIVSAPLEGDLVLANDDLAESMQPEGRLDALVSAAESARSTAGVFSSLCFAVDPELLRTAQAMTRGYRVRSGKSTVAGSGAKVAQRWLEDLRQLVSGSCVIPLPYAGADVTALGAFSPALTLSAVSNDKLITDVLKVKPQTASFWNPGALTDEVLSALSEADKSIVVTDPGRVRSDQPIDRPVKLLSADGEPSGQRVVPTDQLISMGFSVPTPSLDPGYFSRTAAGVPALATQDGVAALAFRARFDENASGAPLLVAPPRRWDARADELAGMLRTLDQFIGARMIEPIPLPDILEAPVVGSAPSAADGVLSSRLPTRVIEDIQDIEAILRDLSDATAVDPAKQVEPAELLRPVRDGALRAASTAWRSSSSKAVKAAKDAREQLDALLDDVQVTEPGRTISLASGAAPLPVFISNELPVAITVRIQLFNTVGLRPDAVGDLSVPANGSVTRQIPAEALRAGVFNVDVGLSTPGGTELGTPVRFKLASTQYGLITVIVTATAAGALLFLSGRRILRRVRAGRTERA